MKKGFLVILACFLVLTVSVCTQQEKPFPKPENLAQKIANFVVANNPSESCLFGESGVEGWANGYVYEHRIYNDDEIFDLKVMIVPERKQKYLIINYYITSIKFDELKTPADLAAELILRSPPKMYLSIYMADDGVDMKINCYRECAKRGEGGGPLIGFTREEMNLPEKMSGIHKYLFHNGEVLRDGEWTEASEEETAVNQEEYNDTLKRIARILGVK